MKYPNIIQPATHDELWNMKEYEQLLYRAYWLYQIESGAKVEVAWRAFGMDSWTDASWYEEIDPAPIALFRFKKLPSYIERQAQWIAENNIKKGSRVKVIRAAENHEDGWGSHWAYGMDDLVGNVYSVANPKNGYNEGGIPLRASTYIWTVPYFVLEPISEPKMVPLDATDQLVGTVLIRKTRDFPRMLIVKQYNSCICYIDNDDSMKTVNYTALQEHYTRLDGSKFEKEATA